MQRCRWRVLLLVVTRVLKGVSGCGQRRRRWLALEPMDVVGGCRWRRLEFGAGRRRRVWMASQPLSQPDEVRVWGSCRI